MDSRNYNIILGKRYLIQKYDKSTILVEFTIEQDVFENEVCAGTNAYECYIVDDEDEPFIRSIYYYNLNDNTQFMKYYDYDDDTMKNIAIYRLLPMEETIGKSDQNYS
jgi:hypothetical protein